MDWLTAVGTGLVAAAAWAILTWLIDRVRVEHTFGKYAGAYVETKKFQKPGAKQHVAHLSITVKRNVLYVDFERTPTRSTRGEIVMNRQLPTSGRGQYDDVKDEEQLWGFWDVQIKNDDTILIHTSYASTHDSLVLQGYIWRRQSSYALLDPPLPRLPHPLS